MIRFKLKILVAFTIGAFTTFTMLLYVTSENARCDSTSSILCFYVDKEEGLASRNESSFRRIHHLKSKARLLTLSIKTTESFGNLRAPTTENVTVSDGLRTRRNVEYGAPTKGSPLSSVSPKYDGKPQNGSIADEEFFYIPSNLTSLLDNKKLRETWTRDALTYYAERQRNMHRGCLKYHNSSEILRVKRVKLNHILIDERRKVLFCYVPKVACTNWKRIFMLLTGKSSSISEVMRIPSYKVHSRSLFTSLQNYSLPEVKRILRDYTKFIFVRNPFERLLSAYHNKLEQHYDSSKYFQARFGKYIIRKFRKNPSNLSLERGDDVTFPEFVDYLVSSDSTTYNEHWQTVTNLCHPCFINYDLIGKYETLLEDSNFVLRYLNMNFSFPVLEKPSRTASSLKKYFDGITRDVVYKLYSIYEMDFKLFGYDLFKTLDWS